MEIKKSFWSKFNSWFIRSSRVLIIDGRLMWLFFAVLAIAIYTPVFFNLHFSEQVQVTATVLQISAFIIFIMRLNEIHKFYNKRSFLESFQRWVISLFRDITPQPPIFKGGLTVSVSSVEISNEELTWSKIKGQYEEIRRIEDKVKESEKI